jgi:HNH endonuclease
VTRVLVTREHPGHHRPGHDPGHDASGHAPPHANDPNPEAPPKTHDPSGMEGPDGQLRAAKRLLPSTLSETPTQPLEVGRATRVIQPAQRSALAVRDGGCVFPDCARPLTWCEAHHVHHWLHGGPTDLANLALLCRAHHRAIHEGGWRLTHDPDGQWTATPPHRRHRTARRHPSAA